MTDQQYDDEHLNGEHRHGDVESEGTDALPAQYGVGPFSIREVALGGVWIVAFVVSFFSVTTGSFASVWTSGLLWILTIGVPTVAVFLIVLRRLSPDGIRRVGSLGVDQFASVAFTVSAVLWLQLVWETVQIAIVSGVWVRGWVLWVELILALAGVALTVFGSLIPPFSEDFLGRAEAPAHRNARPVRALTARPPRAPRPAPVQSSDGIPESEYTVAEPYVAAPPAYAAPSTGSGLSDAPADAQDTGSYGYARSSNEDQSWAPAYARGGYSPQDDAEIAVEVEPAHHSTQAFWALVPDERDIVDDLGIPLFRIGPTAWALVIEDRGASYVVRHEDGRQGLLHDISGVTRG